MEPEASRYFSAGAATPILSSFEAATGHTPSRRRSMPKFALRMPAVLAALALAAGFFATAAEAGQCPAGKEMADATKPATHAAKGVTDTVLGAIELGQEPAKIDGRKLRLRRLVIEPGGIVPWHSHGDRPAIIYVVQGEVIEHASNCAAPIVHKVGEATAETAKVSHWWENKGKQQVILISADLLRDATDQNM
jgi:quercetin dioxygenase-like cupin family protein